MVSSSEFEPGQGTSLYVHVPFCVVKCGYCDFNSYVVEDRSVHDVFLDALAAELRQQWRFGTPVSVFIGGGTPSLLDPVRFERLFAILGEHVPLRECREVSMEANPESLTRDKAAIAAAHGVGRISMGVQSFHPHHLHFLDRAHSAERAEAAFAEVRAAGCRNVSIDLMFGIPTETELEWQQDLERALRLQPDHLSCYNLTFEPGTRLTHDQREGRVAANDEEIDRAMFLWTRERLAAAGFEAYEISNFAGAGGPCRHNDHYWLQGDYVGVGPGASSHRAGVRATNLKPVETWARAALAGLPCSGSAETLRPLQRASEGVWLGIRRRDGVDLAAIEQRIGVSVLTSFAPIIERQTRAGWVEFDGSRLRLTSTGLLLADRIGGDYLGAGLGE
ncbi:MAG: radical SAM family heme chaperone HemW [Planctomycetes bacterium]|nr:radical SAM family heme chaperone HemW [Planctomycetota bacterium]